MGLRENAYDFLNESLRGAVEAERRSHAWKFAVLHVVQALELLLKARLQVEHWSLVYESVDRRDRTVTLAQAVERIRGVARIQLTPREERAIRRAQKWRDPIVHFEWEMNEQHVKFVYGQLFEFLTRFHDEHTDFGALHSFIEPELWAKEAELMEFFRRETVLYNGVEVHRGWPSEIVRAQSETKIELHGRGYSRLRRGVDWPSLGEYPCHDCAIVDGQLHVPMCDMEICPRCFGQLISCGCLWGEGPADSELTPREVAFEREKAMYESIRQEMASREST